MAEPTDISVIVHTRNSISGFDTMFASVAWAHEVIVVDMESTDGTRERAEAAGARVFDTPAVPSVDGIRNRFLDEATADWILAIDPDEYLAPDAQRRISELIGTHGDYYDAFAVPRRTYLGDRKLEGTGWYPDHQLRLFRKGTLGWSDTIDHQPKATGGAERVMILEPPDCLHIHRHGFTDLLHFIRRETDEALDAVYPDDPAEFSLEYYLGEAYLAFRKHDDPQKEGDLSNALAAIQAWSKIVRAVAHWEHLGRRPGFDSIYSLPVVLEVERPDVPTGVTRIRRKVANLGRRVTRRLLTMFSK